MFKNRYIVKNYSCLYSIRNALILVYFKIFRRKEYKEFCKKMDSVIDESKKYL